MTLRVMKSHHSVPWMPIVVQNVSFFMMIPEPVSANWQVPEPHQFPAARFAIGCGEALLSLSIRLAIFRIF
jgi:hypothetical protein